MSAEVTAVVAVAADVAAVVVVVVVVVVVTVDIMCIPSFVLNIYFFPFSDNLKFQSE